MDRTTRLAFLLVILAQAAHSVEEYAFRLYDLFPPARFIADLFGFDRPVGFALFNISIVLFGLWCWFARLRPQHRSARGFAWFWALLELGNGLGHIGPGAAGGRLFSRSLHRAVAAGDRRLAGASPGRAESGS